MFVSFNIILLFIFPLANHFIKTHFFSFFDIVTYGFQYEQHEHGHGKREGKPKGKSHKRITESKAQQKEALHFAQT
jgi:hypothetical protein